VDGLALFGFPEFTTKFLESLKAELPELKKHAEKAFDWSTLPGAKEYDAVLARKLKAKASAKAKAQAAAAAAAGGGGGSSSLAATALPFESDDDDDNADGKEEMDGGESSFRVDDAVTWETSPSEKARRIFEWWVLRVSMFKAWPTALRLVVLVQPSSAFVERLFSQVKLIIEQIGVSGLEETLEARAFVRCNKD
jgi:hypothetical protein